MFSVSTYYGISFAGILLIIFVLYFLFSNSKVIESRPKVKTVLDIIWGLGFPFIGLLFLLVTDMFNGYPSYIAMFLVSVAAGIFSLFNNRKLLGILLILVAVVALILVSILVMGIAGAH